MKVLITGDAGFVGRHFRDELLRRGDEVLGCDTEYGEDCRREFEYMRCAYDLVIHCAANVGGRARIDGDPLAIAENLAIDSDMFRWAVRGGAKRVVYFSSSAAYPVALQRATGRRRLREEDLSHYGKYVGVPDQTYGWAKLTGERLARQAELEGVHVHVFRPFSGYGTDQSLDYPFPSFIQRAVRRDEVFEIWGDGKACRDFIHVDDIVRLVLRAVEDDIRGVFNLCTGVATSFRQLASMACSAADHLDWEPRGRPDKPTGVEYRVGDPTRMEHYLGRPRVTLSEGIHRAVAGKP